MKIICDYPLKPGYEEFFEALAVLVGHHGEKLEIESSKPRRNMGGPVKEWLAARRLEEAI